MKRLADVGRVVFGLSMALLGAQQAARLDFVAGPLIAPAWVPWRSTLAFASGLLLVVAGMGIAANKQERHAAALMFGVLALCLAFFHLPGYRAILHDGVARTRAFETLSLLSAALLLTGSNVAMAGRMAFGASMIVFGAQHFMYAAFIAPLIPSWIPAPLFWVYLTGVAFLAASAAILVGRWLRLAATLLGLMFFLWVGVLHAPRVLAHLTDAGELNSALVALALCGAAWLLTRVAPRGRLYLGQSHPKVPAVKSA